MTMPTQIEDHEPAAAGLDAERAGPAGHAPRRAGVGTALLLSAGLGALVGLTVAYRVLVDNRFADEAWSLLALVIATPYLAASMVAGGFALLCGLILSAAPGRTRRAWFPPAAAIALFAGLAAYGGSGRPLEAAGLPDRWGFAARAALAVLTFVVADRLATRLAFLLARALRPWIIMGFVLLGTAALSIMAWTTQSRMKEAIAAGQQEFAESVRGQKADANRRVLLIGLDGACWEYVEELMRRGELPALSRLASEGVAGPFKSFQPTQSPLIWTTMATGVPPQVHGVETFTAWRLPLTGDPLLRLAPGMGLHKLLDVGQAVGLTHRQPVTARCCRKPRVWDILSAAGVRCAVLGWWATWPAADINGVIVSDTFFYERHAARLAESAAAAPAGAVTPALLSSALAALRVGTEDLTSEDVRRFMDVSDAQIRAMHESAYTSDLIESEFLFLLAMDRTYRNVAVHLLETDPRLRFTSVYLRGLDILGHAALRYGTPMDRPARGGPYGDTVRRYYVYTDSLVQELLDAAGEAATVLVVSDHGFERQADGSYGHDNAPDGVFFARGGPFQPERRVTDAGVYDLMPTLLYLYGLAAPEDGRGRPVVHLMREDEVARSPVRSIATYGDHRAPRVQASASPGDQEAVKRLKALGYLDKEGQDDSGE